MTTELQKDSSLGSGQVAGAGSAFSLVEQIAALKTATADRLVALAAERKLAIASHKKNLRCIDDEVAALAPKQTRNRKPKGVVA